MLLYISVRTNRKIIIYSKIIILITFTPEFPQFWFFLKKKQYLTLIGKLASFNLCENVIYRAVSLVGHAAPYFGVFVRIKPQQYLISTF